MKLRIIVSVVFSVLMLSSCGKQGTPAAGAQRATVTMRDGTQVAGTVLSSSAQQIQIAGDDQVTRTIPMSQVRSVEYSDAQPAAAVPAGQPAAGAQPASTAATPEPAAAPSDHYHAPEAAVTTRTYIVPAGAQIAVRNEETIDSGKAVEGQTFEAEVTRDVKDADGAVVIPRGSNARIVIRSASRGGRFKGAADLVLDLDSVAIDGREYKLDTTNIAERGHDGVGVNKRTGKFAGGGAAIGAIIGAIAGGGKGAAIGAGAGAGAGVVTQLVTKGGSIKVPVESVLTFKLDSPLRVVAAQ
jgi:hypothetical protein